MDKPKYSAFASDMGWSAGFWPPDVQHDGRLFVRTRQKVEDGDLLWWDYHHNHVGGTDVFRIFND